MVEIHKNRIAPGFSRTITPFVTYCLAVGAISLIVLIIKPGEHETDQTNDEGNDSVFNMRRGEQ